MKRLLLAATALSILSTATVTSAQGYSGHDDRGRYSHDNRDHGDRDYRNDRGNHNGWNKNDRGRRNYQRYGRGQRYRGDGVYLSDYRRYGYRAPPRGYRYYRTNSGDVILAAVATGLIASVIAGN